MRKILFTLLVLWGCVPPPPADAPKVTVSIYCFEERRNEPPPFGDGKAYNLFFWTWSASKAGNFRVFDVTNNIGVNVVSGTGPWWQKLTAAGRIEWQTASGGWITIATIPAPSTLPARCTWLVPPV